MLDDSGSLAVAIVRLSYPTGDTIRIVPYVILLMTLSHDLLTSILWLFSSVALSLIAAADILFSNFSLFGTVNVNNVVLPLSSTGNRTFVGALLWYNKFGTYDQSGTKDTFQERNRQGYR